MDLIKEQIEPKFSKAIQTGKQPWMFTGYVRIDDFGFIFWVSGSSLIVHYKKKSIEENIKMFGFLKYKNKKR